MERILTKLPINQYGLLRDIKNTCIIKKLNIKPSSQKRFWFLDAPEYGNVGDQAIALAITKFLGDNFPDFEIIEVQESQMSLNLHTIKINIKPDDIIVLQGGGNLGSLYPPYEYVRRKVIQNFKDNKIIVFPQTVFFSHDLYGRNELEQAKNIYSNNHNLYIFAREEESYNFLKMNFINTNVGLAPDIVFYLNGICPEQLRRGLGICMREDSEKIQFTDDEMLFIKEQTNAAKEIHYISTIVKNSNITRATRKDVVLAKLMEFAKCEFIITDRLHGMIFSYITKTPCVFFDSRTQKSTKIYKSWLLGNSYITDYNDTNKEKLKEQNVTFDYSDIIKAIGE